METITTIHSYLLTCTNGVFGVFERQKPEVSSATYTGILPIAYFSCDYGCFALAWVGFLFLLCSVYWLWR